MNSNAKFSSTMQAQVHLTYAFVVTSECRSTVSASCLNKSDVQYNDQCNSMFLMYFLWSDCSEQ